MKIPTLLRPPLHTLWQTFTATEVAWWAASGHAGVESVHNVSDAKQFAVGAVIAAGAALASAAKGVAKQYGPALFGHLAKEHVNAAELARIEEALDAVHLPAAELAVDAVTADSAAALDRPVNVIEQHFHYPAAERVAVTHPADGTWSPPVDGDPDAAHVA